MKGQSGKGWPFLFWGLAWHNLAQGALSSEVERLLYTQDVGGSTPSAPTNLFTCRLVDSHRGDA